MEQQPKYNYQPEVEEDEERWLNEGGHIAPIEELTTDDTTSTDHDDDCGT